MEKIDYNGFDEAFVNKIIKSGDEIFQEKIYEGDMLICKIDKADMDSFERKTGETVHDAALTLIKEITDAETLEEAMPILKKKSRIHDAASYVGWMLSKSV